MSADSLLEVQNLHVSLPSLAGDVHILKGIDLSVKKGEAIGLTGPSGSGKSTLLMTLAGLELPSAGSVVMNGHCLSDMDEDALARFRQTNIGIVFQSFHLSFVQPNYHHCHNPFSMSLSLTASSEAGASEKLL